MMSKVGKNRTQRLGPVAVAVAAAAALTRPCHRPAALNRNICRDNLLSLHPRSPPLVTKTQTPRESQTQTVSETQIPPPPLPLPLLLKYLVLLLWTSLLCVSLKDTATRTTPHANQHHQKHNKVAMRMIIQITTLVMRTIKCIPLLTLYVMT